MIFRRMVVWFLMVFLIGVTTLAPVCSAAPGALHGKHRFSHFSEAKDLAKRITNISPKDWRVAYDSIRMIKVTQAKVQTNDHSVMMTFSYISYLDGKVHTFIYEVDDSNIQKIDFDGNTATDIKHDYTVRFIFPSGPVQQVKFLFTINGIKHHLWYSGIPFGDAERKRRFRNARGNIQRLIQIPPARWILNVNGAPKGVVSAINGKVDGEGIWIEISFTVNAINQKLRYTVRTSGEEQILLDNNPLSLANLIFSTQTVGTNTLRVMKFKITIGPKDYEYTFTEKK